SRMRRSSPRSATGRCSAPASTYGRRRRCEIASARRRPGAPLLLLARQRRESAERRSRTLIVCVGLATRDRATPALTTASWRFTAPARTPAGADWVHVDHVGWPAVGASDISLLSVDGGNPIDGLDLERVALYAPTEGTDDGRRARLTVVTRGAAGCTTLADAETIDVPAHPVDVVSTLGGGDVFRGSLLACLVGAVELRDALVH